MAREKISETLSLSSKEIHEGHHATGCSVVSPTNPEAMHLCWVGYNVNGWEILIYKRNAHFECCFFRWPVHHEHVTDASLESVRKRAELKISLLEARHLKGADWNYLKSH